MAYTITDIEGIGESFAQKLSAAKITTTEHLLELCGDPKGRKTVAEQTGIGESTLLKWANMADMMRISGVGGQYAELLHAAGVDTVKELRTRNAANLAVKMNEMNDEKKLTKGQVSESMVTDCITKAKALDPRISH